MAASPRIAQSQLKYFFFKSLSRSSALLFGFITLVTVSCSAISYVLIEQTSAATIANEEVDERNANLLTELVASQKQIAIDVIQVQQFLSDYSATRGAPGQDDGLENAAKFAEKFPQDVAAAQTAAADFGSPDLVAALSRIGEAFPDYYKRGVEMAKIYAAKGPELGNKLMPQFDEASDAIQKNMDETKAALDAGKRRHAAERSENKAKVDRLRGREAMVAVANVVVTAVVCLFGVFAAHKWVTQPLSWITFTFGRLVQNDIQYEVYEAGRADEIGQLGTTYGEFRKIAIERIEGRKKIEAQQAEADAERNRNDADRAAVAAEQNRILQLLADGLAKIASYDLRWRMTEDVPPAYRRLQTDFNSAMKQLEAALAEVMTSADVIGAGAKSNCGGRRRFVETD